jgi:hypothetical protein
VIERLEDVDLLAEPSILAVTWLTCLLVRVVSSDNRGGAARQLRRQQAGG